VIATTRKAATARILGLAWLGVTALKVAAYDGTHLAGWPYFVALVTLASALLLAGYLREVLDAGSALSVETVVSVVGSIAFAVASLRPLHSEQRKAPVVLAVERTQHPPSHGRGCGISARCCGLLPSHSAQSRPSCSSTACG